MPDLGARQRARSPWRDNEGAMFDFDDLEESLAESRAKAKTPGATPAQGGEAAKSPAKPSQAATEMAARQRPTDVPDWEAPAPAGWWRVVNRAGCWSAAASGGHMVHWFRCGEVVAGLLLESHAKRQGHLLHLRDDAGEPQYVLADGWMPRPDGSEGGDWATVLEELPTGGAPPRPDVRAAHARVVEERTAMRRRTFGGPRRQGQSAVWTEGSATAPFASGAARAVLLRASEREDFEAAFFRDGYFLVDNALAGGTEDFVADMASLDSAGVGETQAGPWSRSPARRTLWLDEEVARSRYGAPGVSGAIAFLKGIADALNPMLSRHHGARAEVGDPAHGWPLVAPATQDAVLTVPPEVLVAVYPGGGCRLAPHVDNSHEGGRRWNARELTAILYATPADWDVERDGGALKVYPHSTDSEWSEADAVCISPLRGRLVVFFSRFRHEVLPAYRTRRAMQLWIFRPDQATLQGGKIPNEESSVRANKTADAR